MTWDTSEVLFDEMDLVLPRDRRRELAYALIGELPDELWCDYDWLTLDDDVALRGSWEEFCENVKHSRRFFFHNLGGGGEDDRDSFSAVSLLRVIAILSQTMGLIRDLPVNTILWRARTDIAPHARTSAKDFGPPPKEVARQSNRMNPPGIPMMYVASSTKTALLEARADAAKVGKWRTIQPAKFLDLRKLPEVPGPFSEASRDDTLGIKFLRHFAREIMLPVARDDRVHIEYLPSQVVTEYLRDFEFDGGILSGIAYPSTVHPAGWNLALFADEVDLGLATDHFGPRRGPWLVFERAVRRHG